MSKEKTPTVRLAEAIEETFGLGAIRQGRTIAQHAREAADMSPNVLYLMLDTLVDDKLAYRFQDDCENPIQDGFYHLRADWRDHVEEFEWNPISIHEN